MRFAPSSGRTTLLTSKLKALGSLVRAEFSLISELPPPDPPSPSRSRPPPPPGALGWSCGLAARLPGAESPNLVWPHNNKGWVPRIMVWALRVLVIDGWEGAPTHFWLIGLDQEWPAQAPKSDCGRSPEPALLCAGAAAIVTLQPEANDVMSTSPTLYLRVWTWTTQLTEFKTWCNMTEIH